MLLPACIITVVVAWYFGPGIALAALPKGGALHKNMEQVAQVFPRDPPTISYVSLISLVFHLLQIFLHQVMAAGFGIQIPWPVLLVTIPVINILSSLPISWNGLGVRENGYLFFLAPQFLSREHAIAFGVMWLLAMAVSSAIGALVLVFSKDLGWKAKAANKTCLTKRQAADTESWRNAVRARDPRRSVRSLDRKHLLQAAEMQRPAR